MIYNFYGLLWDKLTQELRKSRTQGQLNSQTIRFTLGLVDSGTQELKNSSTTKSTSSTIEFKTMEFIEKVENIILDLEIDETSWHQMNVGTGDLQVL